MSAIDYIDLCDDVKNLKPEISNHKLNDVTLESHKIQFRPKTVALKYIGLSLVKLQYCEKISKPLNVSSSQNGVSKSNPKSEIWSSVWTDIDNLFARRYPLKHVLEQKFEKGFKCPHNRSTFCQNCNKISRIQWINHVRRGHMRIDHEWKKTLKRNQQTGIGNIFEMFCVLCSKNRKLTPLTPNEYIQHLKKLHPNFLPYSDYFTYFQRCYICNDETKSFQNNISHRQMCVTAVNNDPHQAGTANFNNCFKTQVNKTIISVEMENDFNKSFEKKLKSYNYFKRTTLHFWLSRKKFDSRKSANAVTNGNNKQDQTINAFTVTPTVPAKQQTIPFQQYLTNSLLSNAGLAISPRVAPESKTNLTNSSDRFFMPIPFPLRNEIIVKKSYSDWCKIIPPNYSKVPKVNPLYCELCNAMLKSLNTVIYHTKMCHPGVNFIENHCKSCNKRFITLQGYQLHYKNTRRCPVSRKCGICNKSVSVNEIYSHYYDFHKNNFNKVLQLKNCLICRENITEIGKHLFDFHGLTNCFQDKSENENITYRNGSFFNCPSCSFTFISEIELRNHMINSQHHFVCPKCPASKFYLYWEKVNHLNSVHGQDEGEITCELCPDNQAHNETSITQKIKFKKASEKVTHFLEHHDSICHVALTNMNL